MNAGFLKAILKPPIRRHFSKRSEFDGSAKDVCEQIIDKLWNGNFYQTGLGHFDYFWIRDFGIVVKSLIKIGNKDKALKTISWALDKYIRVDKVALCIDSSGRVFNSPKESIDALPWLVYAIAISEYQLNDKERNFLEREICRYCNKFIDPNTGEIYNNISYSELRDAVKYKQSAYSVLMVLILNIFCKKLSLKGFDREPKLYYDLLENKYWNGHYFDADLNNKTFSAECNFFPFFLDIFSGEDQIKSILEVVMEKEINKPFPIKYTDRPNNFKYYWWGKIIMPNYAGSTIWTWMGLIYLQLLQKNHCIEFKDQFRQFTKIIEKYKNFPELLHPTGDWYKTPLYLGEEGMIWSAIYLDIAKEFKKV